MKKCIGMSKYNKSYRVSSVITHTSTFNLSIHITKYAGVPLTYSKNTLELSCCKKWQKSPRQETVFWE